MSGREKWRPRRLGVRREDLPAGGRLSSTDQAVRLVEITVSAGIPVAGPTDPTPVGEPCILMQLHGHRLADGAPAQLLVQLDAFMAAVLVAATLRGAEQLGKAFEAELYRHLSAAIGQAEGAG